MTATSAPVPDLRDDASTAAQFATRVVFAVAGIAMAAWAPLVPLAQARIGLDEALLGTVLLCFGAGSLVAMPLAGLAAARFGPRLVIVVAAAVACVALPGLATVGTTAALAGVLLGFGAALGTLDVAMNLQAIAVERASGRAMMSGFHAMFSVGGIVGAATLSIALSIGLAAGVTTVGLAIAMAIATVAAARGLRSGGPGRRRAATTRFAWPHGIVLTIGALAASAFLVEGAMLDWSAVFLATVRDVPIARAGTGYLAFSVAMTIGRFGGDRIVQRFGGPTALAAGASLAAAGLASAALLPSSMAAIAGFAAVGLGASNVVPVLFTAAGRQTAMPEALAVPTTTTMGYAGLLAGPAAIGFVAHAIGLAAAFAMLALLMVGIAIAGRRLPA